MLYAFLIFPMSCQSYPTRFDHANNIWATVEIMKFLMQFSSACYFLPLRSNNITSKSLQTNAWTWSSRQAAFYNAGK